MTNAHMSMDAMKFAIISSPLPFPEKPRFTWSESSQREIKLQVYISIQNQPSFVHFLGRPVRFTVKVEPLGSLFPFSQSVSFYIFSGNL